ncbi:MAG: fibronectin type III domain-containing protein [Lachnospiraceae bacterium]|nr:fibronectin type III domain-containing protein [Lachnospiraceae bacterium]
MKKIKSILLCITLITTIFLPMTIFAAERDLSDYMHINSELEFIEGIEGEQITMLNNGTVNRQFTTLDEYSANVPVVSLAATMDGETDCSLYWSQKIYKKSTGIAEQAAALKADEVHRWSKNSAIIIKMEDLHGYISGIQIEMGASENGPRDYEIEYSLDGKKYLPLNKASITEANNITSLFEEEMGRLRLDRNYDTVVVKDRVDKQQKVKVFRDVYFRISIDSDYKVNGEEGLYGSNMGEIAIHSVKLLEYSNVIDDPPSIPQNMKAYKTGENTITISWQGGSNNGYEIYLKEGEKDYQKVKTIKGNSTGHCQLRGLLSTGKYKVKIRSYAIMSLDIYSPFTKAVVINMKKQPLLKNLSVNKKVTLKIGKEKKLAVKLSNGTSKNYIQKIKYVVGNSQVATVKAGTIKGKKAGSTSVKTTVTLKSGLKKTFTTQIKVISK